MNRKRYQNPLVVLSCFFVAGVFCFAPSTAVAQVTRILGGQVSDDYPSVGIVGSQRRGGFCTGTLINSNHVLTAAHCAIEIDGPTTGTFEVGGQVFATADVIIHPDFNPVTLANDIAILELSESVAGIDPSQILRLEPVVGDVLTIVGFGATGTPTDGGDGSFGTKRFGFTTVDEVTATLVNWEFDDPTENNTAPGDSGGPGFLDIDGDLFIACITSGGTEPDASLGDMAFNTRVDAFADWIDDVILFSTPPDEPTDDDDVVDASDCDLAGVLGGPFPLLRLLLYLLWALLDLINDDVADEPADALAPTSPDPAPVETTEPAPSGPAPTEPGEISGDEELPVEVVVPQENTPVAAGGVGGVANQRTSIRRSRNGLLSTSPTWKGRIGHER